MVHALPKGPLTPPPPASTSARSQYQSGLEGTHSWNTTVGERRGRAGSLGPDTLALQGPGNSGSPGGAGQGKVLARSWGRGGGHCQWAPGGWQVRVCRSPGALASHQEGKAQVIPYERLPKRAGPELGFSGLGGGCQVTAPRQKPERWLGEAPLRPSRHPGEVAASLSLPFA